MTLRIVIDMNLSRAWESHLVGHGYDAIHWSRVGDARAKDTEIMAWAATNDRIVFTNDLDFGTALALTSATGPSVLQVRTLDLRPAALGSTVVGVLEQCADQLATGALIIVDPERMRMRALPLHRPRRDG